MINTFYKEHPKMPIITSLPLDSTLSIARPIVLKEPKQKYTRYLNKKTNKKAKAKILYLRL